MDAETLANVPAHTKAGLIVMNTDKALKGRESALAVLSAFERGESIPVQAARLGISTQAIYGHLLRYVPEEWQAQQAAKALARVDEADAAFDSAADGVAVSRVREKTKLAQWMLERTARRWYAPETMQVNIQQVSLDPAAVALQVRELEDRLGLARDRHAQTIDVQVADSKGD